MSPPSDRLMRDLLAMGAFRQLAMPVLNAPPRRKPTAPRDLHRQKEAGRQKKARRANRTRGR